MRILRAITNTLLIIAVLLSSAGMVVNQHFCLGELQSVALFASASSCSPTAPMRPAPRPDTEPRFDKPSCCSDASTYLKLTETSTPASPSLATNHPAAPLVAVLPARPIMMLPTVGQRIAAFFHYRPPLLIRDLPVEQQVFRC